MPGLLLDLDGVIYQSDEPIEGAQNIITWLQQKNIQHLFLTNTSSRSRNSLVEKLSGFDIHTSASHILSPPVVCVSWLEKQLTGEKIALFVPDDTKKEFSHLNITEKNEEVAAVIIGDLGESWSFETLNLAFRLLMHKNRPLLIALGMTRYWLANDGLRLDVAPFVSALSHASDTKPIVMGKPSENYYSYALTQLNTPAEQTIMIGDDIRGDIEGAQQAGIRSLLVRTGKFRAEDLNDQIVPDAILDSINDLPAWWKNNIV